jgi:hypothetical protein
MWIMTDKEFVLSVYENAKCLLGYISEKYPVYRIFPGNNDKVIGISFFTEELAWTNAKDRLNFKILNTLKGQN